MGMSGASGAVSLSYIVPAHNSTDVIEGTLKELGERLSGTGGEILVVENGSTDDTAELLARIEEGWPHRVPLRLLRSDKGIGRAFQVGIAASRGERIMLSADDLPFGFDDLDAAERLDPVIHPVVIGSKANPDSVTERSVARFVLTFGFLLLRRAILGMRTRDPQGSFVLHGPWAREVVASLREPGFLFSTELTYVAERAGIRTVEVPVRLRPAHGEHGSRISLSDPVRMGAGLFAVRRRHRRSHPVTPSAQRPA